MGSLLRQSKGPEPRQYSDCLSDDDEAHIDTILQDCVRLRQLTKVLDMADYDKLPYPDDEGPWVGYSGPKNVIIFTETPVAALLGTICLRVLVSVPCYEADQFLVQLLSRPFRSAASLYLHAGGLRTLGRNLNRSIGFSSTVLEHVIAEVQVRSGETWLPYSNFPVALRARLHGKSPHGLGLRFGPLVMVPMLQSLNADHGSG